MREVQSNVNRRTFQSSNKLYHYTDLVSALKILSSKSLRYGRLSRMNDINECYRTVFCSEKTTVAGVEETLRKYKQLSFSQDKERYAGYAISAMWGHYADKGKGVCLVFDKKKLLASLPRKVWYRSVIYTTRSNVEMFVQGTSIEEHLNKNYVDVFFKKTLDWSYEQEYRLLMRGDEGQDEYLQFTSDRLLAIICNYAEDVDSQKSIFESVIVKLLRAVSPSTLILECGVWDGKVNLRDSEGNGWSCKRKCIDMQV